MQAAEPHSGHDETGVSSDQPPVPMGEPTGTRDRLAYLRTVMANERTVLAYVRTALALLISGGSLVKFSGALVTIVLGWLLVPVGLGTFLVGVARYKKLKQLVDEELR